LTFIALVLILHPKSKDYFMYSGCVSGQFLAESSYVRQVSNSASNVHVWFD